MAWQHQEEGGLVWSHGCYGHDQLMLPFQSWVALPEMAYSSQPGMASVASFKARMRCCTCRPQGKCQQHSVCCCLTSYTAAYVFCGASTPMSAAESRPLRQKAIAEPARGPTHQGRVQHGLLSPS